ncbi:MAG: division/cell wall cluster transcriptional repressor MraZ [Eubacteriaceae bacterium]|nr:division/cell wall cluster transcriptional repressor MraZ [Eubacteriaceae bacterium]
MLIGKYRHTIDEKGRISVPAKFREELGESVVVTESIDKKCLYIFSVSEYTEKFQKLSDIKFSDDDENRAARYIGSLSAFCDVDKQGRIMISPEQREHIGLDKDVIIIGVFSRAEMWDAAVWEKYNEVSGNTDMRQALKKTGL